MIKTQFKKVDSIFSSLGYQYDRADCLERIETILAEAHNAILEVHSIYFPMMV